MSSGWYRLDELRQTRGGIPPRKPSAGKSKAISDTDTPAAKKRKRRRKIGYNFVGNSTMYKHVVRAVYNSLIKRGSATRGSPEQAAQKIARRQMIKWGYARRKKVAGGGRDRLQIALTGRGKKASMRHAREPASVRRRKDRDFWRIAKSDPLKRL